MSGLYGPRREAPRQHVSQQDAEREAQDDRLVDEYVRYHFPDGAATSLEGPAPDQPEPTEDEQFAAYMQTHFPKRT